MHNRDLQLKSLFAREINFALRKANLTDFSAIFTLTGVDLSKDRKDLKIFYSVYGADEEKKAIAERLEDFKREIRLSLRKRLRLKIIPNLYFEFDETPEKAQRIEELFSRLKDEDDKGKGE